MTIESTPDTPVDQFQDEIIRLIKSTRTPQGIVALELQLSEYLLTHGFDKGRVRFAKKLLNLRQLKSRKPLNTSPLTLPPDIPKTGGVGVPGSSMAELRTLESRLVLVSDPWLLPLLLAVVHAHEIANSDMPWTFLVGPPGSGKSEYIGWFQGLPKALNVTTLTNHTLFSGLDPEDTRTKSNPGLLMRYSNAIMMVPEFTTILSMQHDKKDDLFGQFRAVYDGFYDPHYGTGESYHWEGQISFLSGVTNVIYKQSKMMATLGPRFFMVKMLLPDRKSMAMFDLNRDKVQAKADRIEMRERVLGFLNGLPTDKPTYDESYKHWLSSLANIITLGRSFPFRDHDGNIEEWPDAEMPGRASQQLFNLSFSLAHILSHPTLGPDEQMVIHRVGWQTLLPIRRHLLSRLYTMDSGSLDILSEGATHSKQAIINSLDEMVYLGILEPDAKMTVNHWKLSPKFREDMTTVHSVPLDIGPPDMV